MMSLKEGVKLEDGFVLSFCMNSYMIEKIKLISIWI